MSLPNKATDQELMRALAKGQEEAMEVIFRKYYTGICQAAYRILPDPAVAEDLAQDVLLELWRRRDELHISGSISAYLRRAVVNRALNYIRDQRLKLKEGEDAINDSGEDAKAVALLESKDLEKQIDQAIENLPDRCRLVFVLSRFEELTYAEIAEKLDISVKTVENQISKALKLLRKALAPYTDKNLGVLLFLIFLLGG
ncbi:MAG: RNA polymerase sigma-70 factor [Bacteroidetes bacterium]|nr:RNA polymerase sigma-70 factor [Bacteroidota bacterium]